MDEEEDFSSDFSRLCRFCLRTQEETVDLFEAGIYDKVTAATRLELNFPNDLAKKVCLECKRQTEEIYRFVCLVKSSDDHLVRFATKEKGKDGGDANAASESTCESRDETEELFLIVVPEADAPLSDHTYPKESASPKVGEADPYSCDRCGRPFEKVSEFLNHFYECSPGGPVVPKCPICSFKADKNCFYDHLRIHEKEGINIFKLNGTRDRWKVFKINLNGRKCNKCERLSESERIFLRHAKESHGIVFRKGEKPQVVYECPACSHRSLDDPVRFLGHLSGHVKDNVRFVKVDVSGNPVSVKKSETSAFLSVAEVEATIKNESGESSVSTPNAGFRDNRPGKSYSCEFCSWTSETKALLSKHLKLRHLTLKREEEGVREKNDYDRHSTSRHAKGIACLACNKIFSNRKRLRLHSALHLVERNGRVCEICGDDFSTDSGLAKHKRIHSAEEGNPGERCKICDRTFSNGKSLEKHEAAHLDPNFFECEICRLPLPSLNRLERHSEIHRRNRATWECDVCDLSFLSKEGLSCHSSRTGHLGNRKPLECNVCHEKFHVAKKFAHHVKLHPKYKTSECSLCGKRLSTLQSLSLHTKRHFESDGILCPECGKRFFEERNYRRHLLTHRGIRPHPCDYPGCGKSFYTLFEIKRHQKYHFDTRDFPCPYCSKKFHESNHLKVHTRTHTGEKPYVCPHCRKGFVTRTRCKQHIKLIHRGEGYDLIQTDISKKVPVFEAVKA